MRKHLADNEGFPDIIEDDEQPKWATWIPSRSPEFKVHNTEGLANSALGQRNFSERFAKYEFKDGKWVLVFKYDSAEIDTCSDCGGAFTNDRWGREARYVPYNSKTSWNTHPVCHGCYMRDQQIHHQAVKEKREREELARLQEKYNN